MVWSIYTKDVLLQHITIAAEAYKKQMEMDKAVKEYLAFTDIHCCLQVSNFYMTECFQQQGSWLDNLSGVHERTGQIFYIFLMKH